MQSICNLTIPETWAAWLAVHSSQEWALCWRPTPLSPCRQSRQYPCSVLCSISSIIFVQFTIKNVDREKIYNHLSSSQTASFLSLGSRPWYANKCGWMGPSTLNNVLYVEYKSEQCETWEITWDKRMKFFCSCQCCENRNQTDMKIEKHMRCSIAYLLNFPRSIHTRAWPSPSWSWMERRTRNGFCMWWSDMKT